MDGNCSENSTNVQNNGTFNEAVCIDGLRVYDSCSELHASGWKPRKSKRRTEQFRIRITAPFFLKLSGCGSIRSHTVIFLQITHTFLK